MTRAWPEHVFVYGSLLSRVRGEPGGHERRLLRWSARRLGWATMNGRLYDLGAFPAAALVRRQSCRVHGEVWQVHEPRRLLAALDTYEETAATKPLYARVAQPVRLSCGRMVTAWVYLCVADLDGFPVIVGGRWPRQDGRSA